MYLHVTSFVDYTVFLWGYLDSCQFSSYYKYCYFKPLSVSMHMCSSFCIEYYISTSEMCNLIQRGCQLVFKSSCIRLHNYMSLPAHKFFFKCLCQLIECYHYHLKKKLCALEKVSYPFPLRPLPLSSH